MGESMQSMTSGRVYKLGDNVIPKANTSTSTGA